MSFKSMMSRKEMKQQMLRPKDSKKMMSGLKTANDPGKHK